MRKLLQKIASSWLFQGKATKESDTDRDGFLSYSKEVHAAGNGFYKGFVGMEASPEEPDSKQEVHYFRGFYVAGKVASILAAVGLGSQAL